MTKFVAGDLFAALDAVKGTVYIPHVCNDQGAWGAGFVVPLGRTFPEAQEAYLKWHRGEWDTTGLCPWKLGTVQFVAIAERPNIIIANMLAQTLGGERPLFYNHLAACMEHVAQQIFLMDPKAQILCPAFGGGLAGGNFNFIVELIRDTWIERGIPTTVFYLPNQVPPGWTPISVDNRPHLRTRG